MSISNVRLKTMVPMERSTSESAPHTAGTTIFYIRTLAFKLAQLHLVLQAISDEGVAFDSRAYTIFESLQEHDSERDSAATVYLRYVGISSSTRAWKRNVEDLIASEQQCGSSFAYRFFRACEQLFPDVLEAAELQRQELAAERRAAVMGEVSSTKGKAKGAKRSHAEMQEGEDDEDEEC